MGSNWIRRGLGGIILATVLFTATAYAVLVTPFFVGFRRHIAEDVVTTIFGRPVHVEGNVSLSVGRQLSVIIENIKIPPIDRKTTPLPDQFIEKISFQAPYSLVFSGRGSVSRFHIFGIQIDFGDLAENEDPHAVRQTYAGIGPLVSSLLNSDVSGDLHISDVLARYRNSASGWDEELLIDEFVTGHSGDGQFIEIDVTAAINGTPFSAAGRVQGPWHDPGLEDLPFELDLKISGAKSRLEGSINVAGEAATMNANTVLQSDSIGQFLDDLGIERTVDGQLTLSAGLRGTFDNLQANNVRMNVTTDHGDTIAVTGSVANISSGEKVALNFDVALAHDENAQQARKIVDLKITGFAGHLAGTFGRLFLSETVVRTNVAKVGLAEIGPISVGRIVKNDENRVGLQDIEIRDGPDDRPTFVLAGHIDDLLGFSSVKLEGPLDVPIHSVLGAKPEHDLGQLGRLSGTVALTDLGGSFGIDRLDAKVQDSGFWDLKIALVLGDMRDLNEIVVDTDLAIPDVKSFGSVFGNTIDASGGLNFTGHLTFNDEALEFSGDAKIIDTEITGRIELANVDEGANITGYLQSEAVKLQDLTVPLKLFTLEKPDNVEIEISKDVEDEIKKSIRVALDLDLAKITNGKNATGRLIGHFSYADATAKLSDFSLEYLGGLISGEISANFQNDIPAYAAKVRVKEWRMGRFLGELGVRAPITGTLYMSIDLEAAGKTARSWVKTMSGKASLSLWGGRVPGRLLDLTGLNLVTWVFSKQSESETSKIVCAVVPLSIKRGVGNGHSMIIETENVQIVGGGTINFSSKTLKLAFMPRPKKRQLIDIVSPFRIGGTFSDPNVKLESGGTGGRAIAEIITLPVNLVGRLFSGNKPVNEKERPCVLPKNTGPK